MQPSLFGEVSLTGHDEQQKCSFEHMSIAPAISAAEFFAGIGLVRLAVEQAGVGVTWANDIEPCKQSVYSENFGNDHFLLQDIRKVPGVDIPDVDLATASFPCTDLSLAGNRAGLSEGESSMFWEFARVLREMGERRPSVILLENVPGFATSHGGKDLRDAVAELNSLGYSCDLLAVNASHFVPQSRLRMFVVGSREGTGLPPSLVADEIRPAWLTDFMRSNADLDFHGFDLALPAPAPPDLAEVVERFSQRSDIWWEPARVKRFISSLSPMQHERLSQLQSGRRLRWRTAYRRTRGGVAVWEMRADSIAGCLRTARGGSSKQAVVEAGRGRVAIRWMTAREYAALQGAPNHRFESVSESKALFGFGDAVCVPVIAWIAREYLVPLIGTRVESAA